MLRNGFKSEVVSDVGMATVNSIEPRDAFENTTIELTYWLNRMQRCHG